MNAPDGFAKLANEDVPRFRPLPALQKLTALKHARTVSCMGQGHSMQKAIKVLCCATVADGSAVEMASGGRGADVKRRLAGALQDISTNADGLYAQRHIAVHEGGTRVEQPDAREAIRAMTRLLHYLESTNGQP